MIIGGFLALYVAISVFAAYLIGRFDKYGPAWGALIWPLVLPIVPLLKLYEWAHRKGSEAAQKRALSQSQ